MTVRDRVIYHYALPEVHLTGASEAAKDQCAANGGQGTSGAQHYLIEHTFGLWWVDDRSYPRGRMQAACSDLGV